MSPRTIFLSRLIGLYCILAGLAAMAHKQATVDMVTMLLRNQSIMFLMGILMLTAGLAMVLAHNFWSGGVLPVVVTVIGWATLIKSLFFLFPSPGAQEDFYLNALQYGRLFYLYGTISVAIGIYLTYSGFRSKART